MSKQKSSPESGLVEYTLSEIWKASIPLETLLTIKGLKARISYQSACLADALVPQIKIILKTQRELLEKYGATKLENGNLELKKDDPKYTEYVTEWESLMRESVSLSVHPVHIPGDFEGLAGVDIMNLGRFIKIEG